jgi:hypothetical protein
MQDFRGKGCIKVIRDPDLPFQETTAARRGIIVDRNEPHHGLSRFGNDDFVPTRRVLN